MRVGLALACSLRGVVPLNVEIETQALIALSR
jgi:hypothetical protein